MRKDYHLLLRKAGSNPSRIWMSLAGFCLLLWAGTTGFAQQGLAPYTPTYTTGITYNSIAGTGTSASFFRNTTSVSTDDNLTSAIDIGFNFVYDGVQICQAQASTNGFLTLLTNTGAFGTGTGAYGYSNGAFSTVGSSVRTIAPFYEDQQTAGNLGTLADLQASIKYQTTGTAPNRVFTVEWINMQDFNTGSTASLNYQVHLFEGTNDIRFVYGTMTPGAAAWTYTLGLNSVTMAGTSPFATTMLFTQQTPNTNTFSGAAQNALATIPATNTQIDFVYGGAAPVPLSGTYTLPGSFATFTAAINALNYNGTSGPVTIDVAAGSSFVEDLPALQTGCQSAPITLQKSGGGANPAIRPTGTASTADFGFRMLGVDNLTWDGIDIIENTGSAVEFGLFLSQLSDRNGCQNNTFKNFNIVLNRANVNSYGILTNSTAQAALIAAGSNSSNTYKNFSITNAQSGIQFNGAVTGLYNFATQTIVLDNNNQIVNDVCTNYNIIGDPLVANDMGNSGTTSAGLFLLGQANLTVSNCSINNLTGTGTNGVFGIITNGTSAGQMPANTYNQGTIRIFNNKIFTLTQTNTGAGVVSGIRANVNGNAGTSTRIYNNAIGGLSSASTATTTRRVVGIQLQDAGTGASSAIEVWHNSVSLNPTGLACPNSCLETYTTTTGPVFTVRNNIFANYTAAQTGSAKHYNIVTTSATLFGNTGSVSNNNDLYIANATNGFVGRGSTTDYATIPNWSAAVSQDLNSFATDPLFVGATDLHVTNYALNNTGTTPPVYVTNDIDCVPRSGSTPDVGVDEFTPPACSGMPTAGTAALSASTICGNLPASLSLTGFTTDTGIMLQWQASAAPGGPYTPIPGANAANYTGVLPVAGTYYITCAVFCANSGMTAISNEVMLVVLPFPTVSVSPTSGLYCAPNGTPVTLTASSTGGTGTVNFTWSPAAGLSAVTGSPVAASPLATTTYVVTGTDANGCAATASSAITVGPSVNIGAATATPTTMCAGNTAALNVTAGTTTNYVVTTVPFASIPSGSGTTVLCDAAVATTPLTAGGLDDGYWNGIAMPFAFSYYGSTYNTIHVGTNGNVSFTPLTTTTGYASTPQMPNVAAPNNMIAGCYGDLAWTHGGTISTYTSGTAPNRIFVVSYNGIPGPGGFYNSGSAPVNLVSFEIQLFENGNKIQVHTIGVNTGTSTANHTMGVENAGGTAAVVVPGRGTSLWSVANDGIEFTPSGGTLTYSWTPASGMTPSATVANPTTPALSATTNFVVTVTDASGCAADTNVTVNVDPVLVPSVSIAASPGTSICAGTSVTFTATPTNEGSTPVYQWLKNGGPVGTNSTTYSDNGLLNGDVITLELTSNALCASPTLVTSNTLTMTVNPIQTPVVSISANPGTTICAGTNVTFTASTVDEGTAPIYQWYLNGSPVGTNSTTYSNNGLLNGDVVAFVLTNNDPCTTPVSDTSNLLAISVVSSVTPSVSIVVSPGSTICPGSSATFTATATNAGTLPSYQWFVNATPVGTNSATYVGSTLVTGDQVLCEVTSNDPCASPTSINSNTITMTVGDAVAPTAVCQNLTVSLDAGGNGSTTAAAVDNGSTDNCTSVGSLGLSLSATSFTCANLGTNSIVLTVTDAASNTGTCTATVTVVDNIAPAITCPANSSTSADPGLCTAVVTYATPSGTDNCTPTTTLTSGLASGAAFPLGTTTNTFTVTDGASNTATCAFTVTVVDNQGPTITCPSNSSLNNDAGNCTAVATYATPVGADNCSGATTVQTVGLASGAAFPVGTTTNTFVVTDGAANTATCSFTVTVADAEAPTWSACPSNMTVGTNSGTCDATVTWTAPTAADNCTTPTTVSSHAPGATFTLGTTTVTYTATDGVGNSGSCAFTVTVSDLTAPNAVCQAVTVTLDSTGNASITAAAVDNGSSDACGISTVTLSQTAFTCANAGANTVTLSVTDVNGNTGTCTATVTVIAPAVTGTLTADTTSCGYNVSCAGGTDGVATAAGGGGCPSYTYLWSNGDITATATALGAGTHYVTITDGAGGTYVDSVSLTAPSQLTVALGTVVSSCAGDSTGSADITAAGGNDCQAYTYLWSNGDISEDLTNVAPGVYTVTVTDAQGCTATQTVTVGAFATPSPTFTAAGPVLTAAQTWATYQWLLNGSSVSGATADSYTALLTGVYSLSVTDTNGCTGVSDTMTIIVVGIHDPIADQMALSIYPNPARGEFRLRAGSPIGYGLTVTISDMYGQRLTQQAMPDLSHEVAFDIQGFSAGTYIVEVVSELGQRRLFKLVVQ
jgi:hypothetical protein